MRKYFFRIENLLLLVAVVLLIFSLCSYGGSVLDIHLHDTYYVISHWIAFLPLIVWLAVLYIFHALLYKKYKTTHRFSKWHIYITVLLCVFIVFFSCRVMYWGSGGTPRSYYDTTAFDAFAGGAAAEWAIVLSVFTFILVQLVFCIYFIFRICKKVQ